MSSLSRYKRSGGFFQLLSLIETFGPQKREKFIEMIEQESPVWAKALREKILTIDRVFTWPDQVITEVFKRLPPKSQAYALTGLKDEYRAKVEQFLSTSEKRRLDDVLSESQPKPDEVASTMVKLLEVSRQMLKDREIHAEKFDDGLLIAEDFESKLEAEAGGFTPPPPAASEPEAPVPIHQREVQMPPPSAAVGSNDHSAEVYQLQKNLAAVLKENKTLKDEVKLLRGKLEQIKKIA
jgi:hypothetical protein